MAFFIRCGMPLKNIADRRRYEREYSRKARLKNRLLINERVRKVTTKYRERNSDKRWKIRKGLLIAKGGMCFICAEDNLRVLDFDHRDENEKTGEPSHLIRSNITNIRAIISEINRCRLLCANCHRMGAWGFSFCERVDDKILSDE